jgi:hypothetical protein
VLGIVNKSLIGNMITLLLQHILFWFDLQPRPFKPVVHVIVTSHKVLLNTDHGNIER